MHIVSQRLQILANKLIEDGFLRYAEDLCVEALKVEKITDIGVITPDHPMYPTLYNMLRPGEAIDEKLANFSSRLGV